MHRNISTLTVVVDWDSVSDSPPKELLGMFRARARRMRPPRIFGSWTNSRLRLGTTAAPRCSVLLHCVADLVKWWIPINTRWTERVIVLVFSFVTGTSGRRMLIVEDEPLMASLLAEVLEGHGFLVQTAADVLEARLAVRTFDPDGILLDISLGDGPSGLDLAHVLEIQRPDIALIFLTKHPDLRTAGIDRADLPLGCGFLRKDRVRDTDYLLDSIESVMTEQPRDARHDLDPAKPLVNLNAKHVDVLRLMATGYTNEHIAKMKSSSLSTVERWTAEIFKELGIETKGAINPRVEAVRQFIAAAGIPERL